MLLDKLKMEFLGAFLSTFFVCMCSVNALIGAIDNTFNAVTIFVIMSILTWIGLPISGAQYNPIVTISLIATQHVKIINGLLMIAFQVFGIIFGACMIKMVTPIEII